jgi:hypothetical protein
MLVYLRFSEIKKNYHILINRNYTDLNSLTKQIARPIAIILYHSEL